MNYDFDVIARSWEYLFKEGMTFTLTLTALSMVGGVGDAMCRTKEEEELQAESEGGEDKKPMLPTRPTHPNWGRRR